MDQAQYHAYQKRARMWSKGQRLVGRHIGDEFEKKWEFVGPLTPSRKQSIKEYALHAPMRWNVTAYCVCKTDDGQRYVSERSATCGQAATPAELTDLRNELMQWARDDVNTRHIWDEYFLMECLG
ncbi:hypothetical protein ACT3R7_11800 [Halomonas sp. AOP43-A1-21]